MIKRQGAGSARPSPSARTRSASASSARSPCTRPKIEQIEVKAIGDVSRAKLYYLRAKVGKKARVREKLACLRRVRLSGQCRRRAGREVARTRTRPALSSPSWERTKRRETPRLRPARCALRRGRGRGRAGSLAGPLVIRGVLFDYERLRDHAVRPLAILNDSKQVAPEDREMLFHAVACCATQIVVRVVPPAGIDRDGLHRSNLRALREALAALHAARRGLPRGRLPPRPARARARAVVDGDTKSAAIAAASIVAKVVRDRAMRRLDALFPPTGSRPTSATSLRGHSAVVRERGPSELHRRSFQALCYAAWTGGRASAALAAGWLEAAGTRRAPRPAYFRLRGYRVLAANALGRRDELDLVLRRGRPRRRLRGQGEERRRLWRSRGDGPEEKTRRVRRAAETWLARTRSWRARGRARGGRRARQEDRARAALGRPDAGVV